MKITNPFAVIGEDAACSYLIRKDYVIIERNFRQGYGEIDIIALDHNILVFVEVKTRSSQSFGSPFDSIVGPKLRTLIKTSEFYRLLHPTLPTAVRIDAIGVILQGKTVIDIEHLENITGF